VASPHRKQEAANWREKMEKPTRLTESLGTLAAEHWEIDAIYGGLQFECPRRVIANQLRA